MLKPVPIDFAAEGVLPAAFRRLCVETSPAVALAWLVSQPPLGGCVLKLGSGLVGSLGGGSRL